MMNNHNKTVQAQQLEDDMRILDQILVERNTSAEQSRLGISPKGNTNSTTDLNRGSDESELKMTPISGHRQLENAKSLINSQQQEIQSLQRQVKECYQIPTSPGQAVNRLNTLIPLVTGLTYVAFKDQEPS
jgi:hypothetical protein